ncbi:hypothetical protein ATANTOWER_001367 [Ataeniobius toweri]|uniref:Secreted protein n=1 Tax=Ataeniobius toweri TaxID=208326 RepID=A0ABU7BDM7_9TELE|nr:hypothetical protein [Ataeniobius toweri]
MRRDRSTFFWLRTTARHLEELMRTYVSITTRYFKTSAHIFKRVHLCQELLTTITVCSGARDQRQQQRMMTSAEVVI